MVLGIVWIYWIGSILALVFGLPSSETDCRIPGHKAGRRNGDRWNRPRVDRPRHFRGRCRHYTHDAMTPRGWKIITLFAVADVTGLSALMLGSQCCPPADAHARRRNRAATMPPKASRLPMPPIPAAAQPTRAGAGHLHTHAPLGNVMEGVCKVPPQKQNRATLLTLRGRFRHGRFGEKSGTPKGAPRR